MTARVSLNPEKRAVIDRAYRCFFVSFATASYQAYQEGSCQSPTRLSNSP